MSGLERCIRLSESEIWQLKLSTRNSDNSNFASWSSPLKRIVQVFWLWVVHVQSAWRRNMDVVRLRECGAEEKGCLMSRKSAKNRYIYILRCNCLPCAASHRQRGDGQPLHTPVGDKHLIRPHIKRRGWCHPSLIYKTPSTSVGHKRQTLHWRLHIYKVRSGHPAGCALTQMS